MLRKLLLTILVLVLGCARNQGDWTQLRTFPYETYNVRNPPHIDIGMDSGTYRQRVRYYFTPWMPGCKVFRVNYTRYGDTNRHGYGYDKISSIESRYIEEDRLYFYIPLLIESLNDNSVSGMSMKADRFLKSVMRMLHPNSIDQKGTPYEYNEQSEYTVDETTYRKWKQWWETKGFKYFKPYP